jgi:hypothetical protein
VNRPATICDCVGCRAYTTRRAPWSPYPEPPPGNPVPDAPETDEVLRGRIAETYGRWGAFLSAVIESSGAALDECATHVGLKRRGV